MKFDNLIASKILNDLEEWGCFTKTQLASRVYDSIKDLCTENEIFATFHEVIENLIEKGEIKHMRYKHGDSIFAYDLVMTNTFKFL